MRQGTGPGNLDGHVVACRKRDHVGQFGKRFWRRWWLGGLYSAHTVIRAVFDESKKIIEIDRETSQVVVTKKRVDRELLVEKLY